MLLNARCCFRKSLSLAWAIEKGFVFSDFQSSFPLPKVKYFDFENVLPGHYIAYVSVLGEGWHTKKEELSVTTHMKFIFLELVHKK